MANQNCNLFRNIINKAREKFKLFLIFFLNIINQAKESLTISVGWRPNNNPSQPLPLSSVASGVTAVDSNKWLILIMGACFAAGSATSQALQAKRPLSTLTQWVNAAVVFSSTAFLVSGYLFPAHKRWSVVAMHAGVLFGFMAFMLALVSGMSIPFMVTSIGACVLGFFIIIFVHLSNPST